MKKLLASLLLLIPLTAISGEPSPAQIVDERQQLFKDIAELNKPIGLMLRNQLAFDKDLVVTNATKIAELSSQIPDKFKVDTRGTTGIKSGANPSVWNAPDDFKSKTDALTTAATELAAAAQTNDRGAFTRAAGNMGKTCGSCHDTHRSKL